MWRNILFARIVGLGAALLLAILLWAGAPAHDASAKTRTSHGVALSDQGGMAVKCKKHKRMPGSINRCPRKGWVALMRSGESFRGTGNYWKFYSSKKKAIRSSERSLKNKNLPECKNADCSRVHRVY